MTSEHAVGFHQIANSCQRCDTRHIPLSRGWQGLTVGESQHWGNG